FKSGQDPLTDSVGPLHQSALQHFNHLQCCHAAEGTSTVGAADLACAGGIHDLCPSRHGADRNASADGLGHRDDVRNHPEVFHSKHLSGPPKTGLHLVGDEQDSVFFTKGLQFPDEECRRNDKPAFALHRLNDDGCHVFRGNLLQEDILDLSQYPPVDLFRAHAPRGTVIVRIGQLVSVGGKGAKPVLVGFHFAGQGHGEESSPVKPPFKREDRPAHRESPGKFHRIFHRLSTTVQKKRCFRSDTWGDPVQLLRQLDVGLVHHDVKARMNVAIQLILHRLHHFRRTVSYVECANGSGEI